MRTNMNRLQWAGEVTYSDDVHTHVKRDDGVRGTGVRGGWIEFTDWLAPMPQVATISDSECGHACGAERWCPYVHGHERCA